MSHAHALLIKDGWAVYPCCWESHVFHMLLFDVVACDGAAIAFNIYYSK